MSRLNGVSFTWKFKPEFLISHKTWSQITAGLFSKKNGSPVSTFIITSVSRLLALSNICPNQKEQFWADQSKLEKFLRDLKVDTLKSTLT